MVEIYTNVQELKFEAKEEEIEEEFIEEETDIDDPFSHDTNQDYLNTQKDSVIVSNQTNFLNIKEDYYSSHQENLPNPQDFLSTSTQQDQVFPPQNDLSNHQIENGESLENNHKESSQIRNDVNKVEKKIKVEINLLIFFVKVTK